MRLDPVADFRHDYLGHPPTPPDPTKIWWRYIVLRGDGIPAKLNGMWYDLTQMDQPFTIVRPPGTVDFVATNMWEQREDGAVAVVYIPKEAR